MRLDLTGERPRIDLDALPLPPTLDQRDALAFDRELAVTAGAGAGKTQTLSLRYAVLLLELAAQAVEQAPTSPRPDIERVLVLTFTDKAAEEMAERCYRRLLALARGVRAQRAQLDAAYGEGYGAGLAAAVDHLVDTADRAAIHTFHGFCARILREFPGETRTPPGFQVLQEADALQLVEEVIDQALRNLVLQTPRALGPLLDAFGRRVELVDAVRVALRERTTLLPVLHQHSQEAAGAQALLADGVSDFVPVWLASVGAPLLAEIVALAGPGQADFVVHTLAPLSRRVQHPPDDPLACNALYLQVLQALCASKDKARTLTHATVLGKKEGWPAPLYKRHKDALAALAPRLADLPGRLGVAETLPQPADLELQIVLRDFSRLVLDATEQLDGRYRERAVVDFTALQSRAVQAVTTSPRLRALLGARHRYLMVDEFQDTDAAQWSLVRAIGRPDDRASDRIFFVGDVKQAIYGFRGGDVTVFDAAARELGVTPLVLRDNFRSADTLIRWFNGAFQSILGPADPGRPRWEAPYEPLRAGREAEGGSVTLVAHEEGDAAAQCVAAEAQGVARLIAAEVLTGQGVYGGADLLDRARYPEPPVAILLQRRTWLPLFERALRAEGVPYVVAKGVGFWSRQEVLDLVNVLHALSTSDPISMVGALRSPLFAVPDDALFAFAPGNPRALATFGRGAVPDGASPDIARAWARYASLLALRDRVPVSTLLRRVVQICAGWHQYALDDGPDPSGVGLGGQAQANAERLVEMAAHFDSRGPEGLGTVAEWFAQQVVAEEREAEATVLPAAARVVLMTVHASKGLEFPVVVVPQAGSRRPLVRDSLTVGRDEHGRWRIACKVAAPVPGGSPQAKPIRLRIDPGLRQKLAARLDAEGIAEDRRLLYVAATRARDHLVVVGQVGSGGPHKGSWLELLAEHHRDELTPADGLVRRSLSELRALQTSLLPAQAVRPAPDAQVAWQVAPVRALPQVELSPSSLDLFAACPARWTLQHILRLPEQRSLPDAQVDWSVRLAGVRGDVLHSLLEDDVAHDAEVAWARWSARAHAEGCPTHEVERLFAVLWAHLERASGDPMLQQTLAAEGASEIGFRIPFGQVVLEGQIDRLWYDRAHGEWVVLDYKSSATPEGPLVAGARYEKQLRAYAWAASRILQAHGHGAVRRGQLYFTGVGQFYNYAPWGDEDFAELERLLARVGEVVQMPWHEVEAQAVEGRESRPCERCPYAGHACRGREEGKRVQRMM